MTIWAAADRSGSYAIAAECRFGFLEHGKYGVVAEPGAAALPTGIASRLRDERSLALAQAPAQAKRGERAIAADSPIARTAHVAATAGGMSGPYPWRPPV